MDNSEAIKVLRGMLMELPDAHSARAAALAQAIRALQDQEGSAANV